MNYIKKIFRAIWRFIKRIGKGFVDLVKLVFFPGKQLDKLAEEALISPGKMVVKKFFKSKTAVLGLITFLIIFISVFTLSAIFPTKISEYDATQQHIAPGYKVRNVPRSLKNPVYISAGAVSSIALDEDGKTYVWGANMGSYNALPRKTTEAENLAILEARNNAVKVSAGYRHFLIEGADGKLYSWGAFEDEWMNEKDPLTRLYYTPSALQNHTGGYKDIYAGSQINAVVTNEGVLHVWGNTAIMAISSSQINAANAAGEIKKVSGNSKNLVILYEDGTLGSLGTSGSASTDFRKVGGNVVDFAVSNEAGLALKEDGSVVVWGSSYAPEVINAPTITNGKKVTAGFKHFAVLTEDNTIISWGNNYHGQLKIKTNKTNVKDLFSGGFTSYSVNTSNKIRSAGLSGYIFGTDDLGRDMFRRLMEGGKVTLTVGAVAVLIATVIGVTVGGISGFFGGRVDNILMRLTEVVNSIPFLPIAMTLSVLIGSKLSPNQRMYMIMVILGVLSWGGLARLVRAQVLAEREKDFVMAAKALGIKQRKIIFSHIIPNVISVIIVSVTLSYAGSLLTESGLSFLGFGVVPPTPTWGNMLTSAQSSAVISNYWWRWIFPSIFISLSTLSINFIGDGLRNAIDPKSSER